MKDKKVGRKKHKRLDAICENVYSRTHRGVEDSGPSESKDGGDEMELRRSSRVRKIPVMLDTSPSPSKKRRKVMKGSGLSNGDCGEGEGEGELGSAVGDDGWGSRLRSRVRSKRKSRGFEVGELEDSSPRGKRKLFEDCEVVKEEPMTVAGDVERKKPGMVGEETTVVKSKRPGRIKASNILEDQCPKIDLGGSTDDDKEESIDGEELDVSVQVGRLFASEIETDVDKNGDDANAPPASFEVAKGGIEVDTELEKCPESSDVPDNEIEANVQLEECHRLDQLGDAGKYIQDEVQASGVAEDHSNAVEINAPNGDCNKDSDKPLETMPFKKLKRKRYHSDDQHGKIQIKEGRRCGLCGTGSEGKPPRKLVQDGAGSDNEAYSGSSSSEEPNYDMWDGFGDEPGWLGRLLGPMNDRHGIAGIWIHQQCAVWSPEVYFAGLGCLKNVRAALCRGRVLKCTRCGRPGATIGCRVDRCPRTYHLACARVNGCIFDHRKFLIACTEHKYLFQPHGSQNANWLKKLKMKKVKMELKKSSNEACRKDVEAEEKWLENCGEDEEFLKRESKRLHRDLLRIAPTYIGGSSGNQAAQLEGWESVAGLQSVIQCLKEVVILPLLYPEYFDNLGLTPPRGVLLHGYPGTGKTLVVRALIGACARGDRKIAYFARKGADCLGKYVGDSERQLRLLFQVAEKSQPSIIFFDEIDGLAPCRTPQQDQTHSSVVSTLLALMDGLKSRGSVIVIGATNRPDAIDPALRRPGRFDREIYFPLPSVDDRESILSLHTRKWPKPISGSLLKMMARKTVGFAGADIQALCTQAAIIALRRSFPLQKILSAAADKTINYQRPPLPSVVVQERDWLEAFACAAPPCSRREAGCTTNELLSSPLPTYLESCLLQPLSRMIVSLYLDERVWLPPPISKAASLIENVIVSELGKRKVNQDNWWSHVTDLLEEAHISSTIEDGLKNVGIIEGGNDILRNDNGDGRPDIELSRVQCSRPGLLQNESYDSKKKSGFRLLISGNRKSGQSHLASCLLHYFLGNVEVQKIDLATISHQGHGDVVQGLQQVLMRCASLRYCMIFMPRIDLWAVEIFNQEELSLPTEFELSEGTSCNGYLKVDKGDSSPNSEVLDAVTKASYLWNLFVEQVESMSINSSLTIVATSEVQLSKLPQKIQQFFNVERINDGLLTSMGNSVPQFSVELDGIFDFDSIVESCSVRLSKDLAQHFAQFMHYGNHIHVTPSPEYNVSNVDQPSATETERKQLPATTVSPASQKGKSSLMVAIYTFGCQILFYPHFAELCWVTSKIKEGPCASIHGPWKGWPFNSCTVDSTKNNEKSSIVRGLIAVGLSAYKGEYMSLRQVVSDVRKVLDLLVRLIDAKVEAGKDRYDYIRVMSQVAYLEDMVLSWAHTLQRFEADAQPIEPDQNIIHKTSLNNGSSNKMCPGEGDVAELHLNDATESEPLRHSSGSTGVEEEQLFSGDRCHLEKDASLGENNVPPENIVQNVNTRSVDGCHASGSTLVPESDITCFYRCCPECFVNLQSSLKEILNQWWGTEKNSAIEDVHDFVSRISSKLHSAIRRLPLPEKSCCSSEEKTIEDGTKQPSLECHNPTSDNGSTGTKVAPSGLDFIFRNGVLTSLDISCDASFHCKWETLCICSLVEWIRASKESFICG